MKNLFQTYNLRHGRVAHKYIYIRIYDRINRVVQSKVKLLLMFDGESWCWSREKRRGIEEVVFVSRGHYLL